MWRSIRSWLRSLGFSHVFLIQESHIFKWADPKNWSATPHQIFRVCRGHKGGHNDTVLGEFDEGILRGEGEGKFLTPHISPLGGQGVLKFLWLTGIYRPHVQAKYRALEFTWGTGGIPKKISPHFWVARGEEQISDPLGNGNLFSGPGTSEVMYAGNTGV